MDLLFENLPTQVNQLSIKMDNIEKLLLEKNEQQKTEPEDQLFSVEQTAKFLNLTIPTIYSKTSRKELPVMKQGKRLYFSKFELIEYVKRGKKLSNYEIEHEASNYLKKKGGDNE
ncbi:MAG: helix-turn-helix domain-containing protein [Chlorobi bacterium]|nr:helix-turn-helix domain-containing protein [Chlorobiota bacterium]